MRHFNLAIILPENSSLESRMALGYLHGLTGKFTRENLKMGRNVDKGFGRAVKQAVENAILENGSRGSPTDLEFFVGKMGMNIKVSFMKVISTVRVGKSLEMVMFILETIRKASPTDMVSITGSMEVCIRVISKMDLSLEKAFTKVTMHKNMKESTKWI